MALSPEQIHELEEKIADGITPPCPICGSTLLVSTEQVGKSGANGKNYSCSRDKLSPERWDECELKPGIAYVNWKQNLRHSLRNRAVQLALAGIGSISLVGLGGTKLGFIEFHNQNDTTVVVKNDFEEKLALKDARIFSLETELSALKSQGTKTVEADLGEEKWKLGYGLVLDNNRYKNTVLGKTWLIEALENNEVTSDNDKKEVLKKLSVIHQKKGNNSTIEDWIFLKTQLLNDYSLELRDKYLLLGETYHNLQFKKAETDPTKLKLVDTALCYYACAINRTNHEKVDLSRTYAKVEGLLHLWYGNAESYSDRDTLRLKLKTHGLVRNVCD